MENISVEEWLTEKMNANAGYSGQRDPTILIARKWEDLRKERNALYHATRECAGVTLAGKLVVIDSEKLTNLWKEINEKEATIAEIEAASAEMIKADGRCLADILEEYAEIDRKNQRARSMFLNQAEQEAEQATLRPQEARGDVLRGVMQLYRNRLIALQVPVFELPIPPEGWVLTGEKH